MSMNVTGGDAFELLLARAKRAKTAFETLGGLGQRTIEIKSQLRSIREVLDFVEQQADAWEARKPKQ